MGDFTMPSLGAEMDEGRLVEWLVHPGDTVHRGDTVAVVETDKAAIEVEVWEDGVVSELLVDEGARVPVGTPLARIGDVTPATVAAAPAVQGPLARHRAEELHVDVSRVHGTGPGGAITRHDVEAAGGRKRVSPYARRLAVSQGLDLSEVTGTGPGGAVVAADVATAPSVPAEAEPARELAPTPSGDRPATMRAAIARAMARSKQTIPHYYLGHHVDVTEPLNWLADRNAARPVRERTLPAVLFLRAVARACRDVPELNGFWQDDQFVPSESVHLGVAVALRGGGLIAPAILDADRMSLDDLMAALRDLVARVRAGRLRGRETTAATITVTSLGDLGVESVYGVIHPPQVALVGIGKVVERPWAVDGLLGVRQVVHLTLSADHRASDGMVGARFLARIAERLAETDDP